MQIKSIVRNVVGVRIYYLNDIWDLLKELINELS